NHRDVDAGVDQLLDLLVLQLLALMGDLLAVDLYVLCEHPPEEPGIDVSSAYLRPIGPRDRHGHGDPSVGLAVELAHDQLLGDVDQASGQVTRVGGTKRRVGESLPRTVGGDEV